MKSKILVVLMSLALIAGIFSIYACGEKPEKKEKAKVVAEEVKVGSLNDMGAALIEQIETPVNRGVQRYYH